MRAARAALVSLSLLACGGARQGYVVSFELEGPPTAFNGRSITVGGRLLPEPGGAAEPGMLATYIELCTANREHFLNARVRIAVREADTVIDEVLVERVACRDAEQRGVLEINHLIVDEAGHVNTDFGNNAGVWASCTANAETVPCPTDEL